MQIYTPPIKDYRFLIEALGCAELFEMEAFQDFDSETLLAILEEAGKFCTEQMLPLNRSADTEGLTYDPADHSVTTPQGFKDLYQKFRKTGILGLCQDPEYGGSNAPYILGAMIGEMTTATNKSFSMCPGLTNGLVEALAHYGSAAQKDTYMTKMISGEWTGTMCLTEPQCGTDLGLMKTRAVPDGDAYRLTGTKIWITFGEHDLADNIIHLVLARLPDAPPGIKGISTFLVPKINHDGTRNSIYCTGLEHKMGIHGSPTCVMTMEDATGYLIGEPHKGMKTMFVMMNNARIAVAMEGLGLSEISYQTAVAFAKERRQMRSLDPGKRDMDHAADCILVHPDVRRMLLNIKATNEGMRALGIWTAMQGDISLHHADEERRNHASDLLALMTPIVKSYCSERGFLNTSDAMQVMGGAGYTADWSVEQYMRDIRIAMIYEGTNHIQALDLVGRKLPASGGRAMRSLQKEITGFIRSCADNEAMNEFLDPLKDASKQLTELTMHLAAEGMKDQEEAGAIASNYLNVFALTMLAWIWAVQIKEALGRDDAYAATKIKTGRYFFHQILPERHSLAAIMVAGKQHMMAFDVDEL